MSMNQYGKKYGKEKWLLNFASKANYLWITHPMLIHCCEIATLDWYSKFPTLTVSVKKMSSFRSSSVLLADKSGHYEPLCRGWQMYPEIFMREKFSHPKLTNTPQFEQQKIYARNFYPATHTWFRSIYILRWFWYMFLSSCMYPRKL